MLSEPHPEGGADILAELLLAPLAASIQVHLSAARSHPVNVVRTELLRLARAVTQG